MVFLELVKTRRSVRRYLSTEVERGFLDLCIEAARRAPSASNSQPWRFVLVDDPSRRDELAAATRLASSSMNRFVAQAPVIVVLTLDRPKAVVRIGARIKHLDYPLIDAGIAAEHFCLQAAELGLGTCMIGWFNARRVSRILGIPKSKRPVLLITVGHPDAASGGGRSRKRIEDIRSFNRWDL